MSVFTSISVAQMRLLLQEYQIGQLVELKGIAQGITNTNYFVTTTEDRFVLTVFEALKSEELPFYLELMKHLSVNGVLAPEPQIRKDGQMVTMVEGKPASIISCLAGKDVEQSNPEQCFSVGRMLAKMHLAGQSYPMTMTNPRFKAWWYEQSEKLYGLMPEQDSHLLKETIALLDAQPDTHLPAGVIHADLFKDNVLMSGNEVTGFIDFYYACNGTFIYDIAITLNDWARNTDNSIDPKKQTSLLAGYQSVRALLPEEEASLPLAQQAACVRFWVSRAIDYYFPPEGEMTYLKNQNTFRDVLIQLKQ